MIEELPDELEQDELDDIEPVGDENQALRAFPCGSGQRAGDGPGR